MIQIEQYKLKLFDSNSVFIAIIQVNNKQNKNQ